ncbi:MAG: DUF58 domain-containing protein [Gammaproteobacteria bacterium]|nr:MAG: DUF58 domain-containing protein [Gammaproteobacteria bacterium]
MDWTKIRRKKAAADKPAGVYTNLDDLIRIQFKARNFSFLPQQPVSSILSGRYASRLRGRGLNFEEIRRYLPGDDIRTMDWKVTARTRTPHVRVYTEEKDRAVVLIVDQRINMFFGTRDKVKSVTAAELAALGAWRAVDVGDRVGAVVFNDTEIVDVRPQRSQQTVMSILGTIVRMNHALQADTQAEPSPDRLNRALEKALQLVPHDALVVMISDYFGVDERTEQLTAQMAEHNDVLALLVHDPIRLQPAEQQVTVSDGSLQIEINFADKRVREKLAENYYEEQQYITHFLNKLAAPLLMVSNEGDVVNQVRRLLGVPGRAQ